MTAAVHVISSETSKTAQLNSVQIKESWANKWVLFETTKIFNIELFTEHCSPIYNKVSNILTQLNNILIITKLVFPDFCWTSNTNTDKIESLCKEWVKNTKHADQ